MIVNVVELQDCVEVEDMVHMAMKKKSTNRLRNNIKLL
jgi:hypothetical protein